VRVFYSDDYVANGTSFDTTRKSQWVAESLQETPLAGVVLTAPPRLAQALLERVHSPAYLAALEHGTPRVLAESAGFAWDPGLWRAAAAQAAGCVAAALASLEDGVSGTLSSGLHHAHHHYGSGFCSLNGLALAVHALASAGLPRVLVLDLDAHCGGGTHEALLELPAARQLDLVPAHSRFDDYHPRAGRLIPVRRAADYLATLADALAAEEENLPEAVVYNAGMDLHEGSRIGGLSGVDATLLAAREHLVFDWCRRHQLPVSFALAGGYTGPRMSKEELVGLHRLTVAAAANLPL
jgi:acetoin utilization deacetylase AcuC-like enzyme